MKCLSTRTVMKNRSAVAIRPCHTLRRNEPFSCDSELQKASQTIAEHVRYLLQTRSSVASQLLTMGYFPAMVIAAMAIRNIQLSVSTHISHERTLKAHHFAENRLQIRE